jgi:hypothetical protein
MPRKKTGAVTSRKVVHKLGMRQSQQLMNLIESEYATSGMTDVQFGKYASEKLGIESMLTRQQIAMRRAELGIGPNADAPTGANSLKARVEALEAWVASVKPILEACRPLAN